MSPDDELMEGFGETHPALISHCRDDCKIYKKI
jgi:hypothetical protein